MPFFPIFEEGFQSHFASIIVFHFFNKSLSPTGEYFLKSQFSGPLFQQQIEHHVGKNEFGISRYSMEKLSNIQSMFLNKLESKQGTLRSGSLHSRSTKKVRTTTRHHELPSFLCSLQVRNRSRNLCEGSSSYNIISAVTPLFHTPISSSFIVSL